MAIEAFAPAKINLTLHVTGRRADGYHLLDSLVAFAGVGDRVTAEAAPELTLMIDGPEAAALSGTEDNLVLRAARCLAPGRGAALKLWKELPVSSGIGGGSSDAAAALRALSDLWGVPVPNAGAAARLGADVPVCLDPAPQRMSGVGETLQRLPSLPPVWVVLANPRAALSTPAVFAALRGRMGGAMPQALPQFATADALADFLRACRNDLEHAAIELAPAVGAVRDALAASAGCLVARMSGSGATCFGLYATQRAAEVASAAILQANRHWWVKAAPLLAAT